MQSFGRKKTYHRRIGSDRLLSIIGLVLSVVLCRLRIHTYHEPFVLGAMLGATLAGMDTPWAATGIVLGNLIGAPSWSAVACAVLYALITQLLRLFAPDCKQVIHGIVFLGSSLITLPLSLLFGAAELKYGLVSIPISLVCAVVFYHGYRILKQMRSTHLLVDTDQQMLLVCLGLCVLALSEISIHEIALGRILILLVTMLFTLIRGVYGTFVAAMLSVSWIVYTGSDGYIAVAAVLGASLGAPLHREGRVWIAVGHFAAELLLIGLRADRMPPIDILNTGFAAAMFLMLPRSWIEMGEELLAVDRQLEKRVRTALERSQTRTAAELDKMGKLLIDCSETFDAMPQDGDTVRRWTLQGALAICMNCSRQPTCWTDADAMAMTVSEMAERLDNAQTVIPQEPIPKECPSFADLCASILLAFLQAQTREALLHRIGRQNAFTSREFCGAGDAVLRLADHYRTANKTNSDLEKELVKALLRAGIRTAAVETIQRMKRVLIHVYLNEPATVSEKRILRCIEQVTGRRYRTVGTEQTDDGIRILLEPAPRWSVSMRVSQASLEAEANGDSFGETRKAGGQTLFALSDGMGSGPSAKAESDSAIRTLFRLYDAGLESDLIYENVNRMLLAGGDEERYATLDAVAVDLNEGTAQLLKFGTPPSYLLRGTALYTLCGEALPCGILDDARPTVIPIEFRPDDSLFLCTDGIVDALSDELENVLLSNANRPDTAERILEAAKASGQQDDLSVMVLKVSQ